MTFQDNANGSVTVLGFPRKVKISPSAVRFERTWAQLTGQPWFPKPIKCWKCGTEALFHTSTRQAGPELALLRYECASCGFVETEPLD